jgi:hypothetical protein
MFNFVPYVKLYIRDKLEHRLFFFISSNWRREPLLEYEMIVNLAGSTTTSQVLKVVC